MYKYLEFKNDKSSKFWEIHLIDFAFTTRYGKIGSKGSEKTKQFSSAEEAEKEAQKVLSQKLKKGYVESAFHEKFVKNIDRMMAILFKYEASDSDVELNLKRPDESDLLKRFPRSYLYLVRTYGTIGYLDMFEACYSVDPDDFEHDEMGESFFVEAKGFQFSGGQYCIDTYAFKLDSDNGNSEFDIISFSHDDESFVSAKDFTSHILNFFFKYFGYYSVPREGKIDETFELIEQALEAGQSPKKKR